ncbi:hypothetical protein Q8F55_001685 [Vanrija albida]|uniref:Uncharacterized protein n=1 Tax=Vanrija albida TaxID=181172 RepID=A0ABR3Q7V1_9TREE
MGASTSKSDFELGYSHNEFHDDVYAHMQTSLVNRRNRFISKFKYTKYGFTSISLEFTTDPNYNYKNPWNTPGGRRWLLKQIEDFAEDVVLAEVFYRLPAVGETYYSLHRRAISAPTQKYTVNADPARVERALLRDTFEIRAHMVMSRDPAVTEAAAKEAERRVKLGEHYKVAWSLPMRSMHVQGVKSQAEGGRLGSVGESGDAAEAEGVHASASGGDTVLRP